MIIQTTCLLTFVKYPEEGKVKTRLGRQIGYDRAAKLYKAFVETTLLRLKQLPHIDCKVYFDPAKEADNIRKWLGEDYEYQIQPEGDLGHRLKEGFRHNFKTYQYVAAIGSDSPNLPLEYIVEAQNRLREKDIIIGPTQDGGYYLIGQSRPILEIFDDIPWSTSMVMQKTLEKAKQLNASVTTLPEWYDIDTLEDLKKLDASEFGVPGYF